MDAQIAQETLLVSQTYQTLPTHHRVPWLNRALSLGDSARPVIDGEVFQSSDHCFERLNAWGFIQGTAFVKTRSRHTGTPSWTFSCALHSEQTRNWRQLEDRVIRDEEGGEILSQRKRDTRVKRMGCRCEYSLSYKKVTRAGTERFYTGKWRVEAHNGHEIPLNPFGYQSHLSGQPEYQQLQTMARKYRLVDQPYSEALKLLKEEGLGLVLKPKEYYNLLRGMPADYTKDGTATALLQVLTDHGATYRTLQRQEWEEGKENQITSKKLLQIFFYFAEGLEFIRRFCSSHLLIVDATFNTNSHRLPLLVAVGVTNEGRSFPAAYSYCPGETWESFCFFFECLRKEVFTDGFPEPAVVLTDQAAGLISAVDFHDALPNSQLQFCNWHAVQAMITKLRKERYTSIEIDGYINDSKERVFGLKDLCWAYVHSQTLADLETNREALLDRL